MNGRDGIVVSGRASEANAEFYRQQGYLVAPDLLSSAQVAELKRETVQIFRGNRGYVEGLRDVAGLSDVEVLKSYVAIHFPHKMSKLIAGYMHHPAVVEILRQIVSPNVKCMQSMLFVKAPGKAGQSWHQDEYYIPTRDRSLVGAWIALDDASIDNGCLRIIPGSNRPGYIMRRIAGRSAEFAESDTLDVSRYDPTAIVPVEVKSGAVVFFNGHTLHSSTRNRTTDAFRMALVYHYMSAESMLPWDQDGKQPLTEDLRDIVMVAGEDPYAWKGVIDVHRPFLRSEAPKPRV